MGDDEVARRKAIGYYRTVLREARQATVRHPYISYGSIVVFPGLYFAAHWAYRRLFDPTVSDPDLVSTLVALAVGVFVTFCVFAVQLAMTAARLHMRMSASIDALNAEKSAAVQAIENGLMEGLAILRGTSVMISDEPAWFLEVDGWISRMAKAIRVHFGELEVARFEDWSGIAKRSYSGEHSEKYHTVRMIFEKALSNLQNLVDRSGR
ncbi:MAG: hypothetical protein IT436_03415 [Phycisphaerales bacterium]|nr:hypothetical protein [Phycisphaerales bacterium]